MKNPPSLNGLRTFETAARTGSFVRAAKELGVSSAAVSIQVKRLEDHLGKTLFHRHGNKLRLTEVGRVIYSSSSEAFNRIFRTTQQVMSGPVAPTLTVSALPSICDRWLLNRLVRFKAETDYSIELRAEEDPVDFQENHIDMRVTYDSSLYRSMEKVTLYADQSIVVCSPEFWETWGDAEGTLHNVPQSAFIHSDWGTMLATEASWQAWFARAGIAKPEFLHSGLIFNRTSDAIMAAEAGAGIALVSEKLVRETINAGHLVCPTGPVLEMSFDYVAVYSKEPQSRRPIVRLATFLQSF
ncbi:LysR family transcriptional regulator [Ruegeria sp. 2012CJ41-6]|uniref:LysR family transcriptional regulator n=1 Tax=Ruegeria spongiae TaxID=2942209 RepID=A0ABT0Q8H4_9RHOB|nr:LysR family transcriptional regulator [Ruegeria spongiae]MCL6286181.1 LysR family transcriptional regulator [Ruegeria spongiae]